MALAIRTHVAGVVRGKNLAMHRAGRRADQRRFSTLLGRRCRRIRRRQTAGCVTMSEIDLDACAHGIIARDAHEFPRRRARQSDRARAAQTRWRDSRTRELCPTRSRRAAGDALGQVAEFGNALEFFAYQVAIMPSMPNAPVRFWLRLHHDLPSTPIILLDKITI